jgi:hypothetical protein
MLQVVAAAGNLGEGISPAAVAPWLALAGLGAFHGLNPAMGWLFSVALGLHRNDRTIVWLAPIPIALGHAAAVGTAAAAFVWAGLIIDARVVRIGAGLILMGWALYQWRFGHRHRVRFGMRAGLAGLAAWSFLMASGHGAGLMVWPALMPLCLTAGTQSSSPLATAFLGIGLHTLAMMAITVSIAVVVYDRVGLEILRRAWINVDVIWTIALFATGLILLLGA